MLISVRHRTEFFRPATRPSLAGLGCEYSNLKGFKVTRDHDYDREYRDRIATTLIEVTGKDFGTDQKK
jgi:hypothetical protein